MRRPKPCAQAPALIGWREWVSLPDLGVAHIKAKIDTGARTSAIHAWHIRPFSVRDQSWVAFELHPNQRDNEFRVPCEARVIGMRKIRNSGGRVELRHVISTIVRIGHMSWPIELSLTTRDEMGFRMLLGRAAMRRRLVVDPAKSFLLPPALPKGSREAARTHTEEPDL